MKNNLCSFSKQSRKNILFGRLLSWKETLSIQFWGQFSLCDPPGQRYGNTYNYTYSLETGTTEIIVFSVGDEGS